MISKFKVISRSKDTLNCIKVYRPREKFIKPVIGTIENFNYFIEINVKFLQCFGNFSEIMLSSNYLFRNHVMVQAKPFFKDWLKSV